MAAIASSNAIWKLAASDLTSDLDLSQEELVRLLDLAVDMKRTPSRYARSLAGRYLSLLFEKPSLRTRLTFELAIKQLGGDSVLFTGPIAEREPLKDVARNLARWTHGIVARTFSQETIQGLADWSSVPVINALSDLYHPCQALADVLTIKERFGNLRGLKLAFIGDGNNVAHSLMLTCVRLGMTVAVATPEGYEPNPEVVRISRDLAERFGGALELGDDPIAAVCGAQAVYTDVWASMGQEAETEKRLNIFRPYQVGPDLMMQAPSDAVFLHCLPAKRGQETTDDVIESPQSAVFDQAENRLHSQKALLMMMLG